MSLAYCAMIRATISKSCSVRPVAIALIAGVFGACAETTVPLEASEPEWRPLVEPFPLVMGVYYSPEFRGYENRSTCAKSVFKYHLGPSNVTMFDHVLKGMFREVVAVGTWPPISGRQSEVDAVIEPRLAFAKLPTFQQVVSWDCGISASIDFTVVLHSPTGDQLASWSVTGYGGREPDPAALNLHLNEDRQAAVRAALRNAAANFIRSFEKQPGVEQWLVSVGIHADNPGGRRP